MQEYAGDHVAVPLEFIDVSVDLNPLRVVDLEGRDLWAWFVHWEGWTRSWGKDDYH